MTFRKYRQQVVEITGEQYDGPPSHPLVRGIERARFMEGKLGRLIALASQQQFKTAQKQAAAWQRVLERTVRSRERMRNTLMGRFPLANSERIARRRNEESCTLQ